MLVNPVFLIIATVLYIFIVLLHLVFFAVGKKGIMRLIWVVIYAAFGFLTAGLLLRWWESYRLGAGHAPMTNFYESIIFYGWCISLILIVMKKRLVYPVITLCATMIIAFFMTYVSISPSVDKDIQPLIPALQSNWLHIHVLTCFVAYATFAVSFICGILYFFAGKRFIPSAGILEEINYRSVMIGFPMLSAGILTGAVWAYYAWGSYWSWDPKETWSLITWIIYAIFLHARFIGGWKGRKIALVSIIGFLSVVFTYFGVNFVLSGLHSYAT